MRHSELPQCCSNCLYLEDAFNELSDTTCWYCERGVFFPVKKQTCAKQRKYKREETSCADCSCENLMQPCEACENGRNEVNK